MICGDLSLFEFGLHATARAGESSRVGSLPDGMCILTASWVYWIISEN
jgi:hypothetical protein